MSRLIIQIDVDYDDSITPVVATGKLYKTISEALIQDGMRSPRGANLSPHPINAKAILFTPISKN